MIDKFGRSIESISTVNGKTLYRSSDDLEITLDDGLTEASVISVFNGMSPSIGSLSSEKQKKLLEFNAAMEEYVGTVYDLKSQFRLKILYDLAVTGGLVNRAAYILPALNWAQAVIAYSAYFCGVVMAQSDVTVVHTMQWDFTQINPGIPNVTLLGAISIAS